MRKHHSDISPKDEFERSAKALELKLDLAGAGQLSVTQRSVGQAFQMMNSTFESLDDGAKTSALERFSLLQQRYSYFAASQQNAIRPLEDFRL